MCTELTIFNTNIIMSHLGSGSFKQAQSVSFPERCKRHLKKAFLLSVIVLESVSSYLLLLLMLFSVVIWLQLDML